MVPEKARNSLTHWTSVVVDLHGYFPGSVVRKACAFVVLTVLAGVTTPFAQEADEAPREQATAGEPAALKALLYDTIQIRSAWDADALRRFYEQREYRFAWAGNPIAAQRREIAIRALDRAAEDGLDPSDYRTDIVSSQAGFRTPERLAAAHDLTLSDAVLHYMRDIRTGRIAPDAVSQLIGLAPPPFDAVTALLEALTGDDFENFIAEMPPPHEQYARLREELSHYRQIQGWGGWPQLPAQSEIVYLEGDPRTALLRERLAIEFPELGALERDDNLAAAARVYQARNGLEADGRIGPRTLAMLNVPVAWRIEQIAANMERWRWMPRRFEPRYVVVNVPDATLAVVEGNEQTLTSRVIVGNPRTPTPMFRAEITGVTANPPWNVPASIARNEMLPRLRSDPRYLADRNMMLVNGPQADPHGLSIDWAAISPAVFPYQIRQLPGPDNALGEVKLELPNRFNVFLHDTPARNLFARADRFLSHGCIRVQQIIPLASYALEHNSSFSSDELMTAIAANGTAFFPLAEDLPVYILYWTATANDDGSFGFRNDVYSRDDQLVAALNRNDSSKVVFSEDFGCPLPT
jgi:murein L,D-transpeptidase YcbB/YkuD